MRFLRHLSISLLAASVAVIAAAAPGMSADRPGAADPLNVLSGVTAPTIGDPISDAELDDLQTIAEQSGLSIEAAIERYAWNDDFAMVVDEIRAAVPDAFTGAEIVDADEAWLAFAGSIPKEAEGLIDGFRRAHDNVSVDLHDGRGFTEAALARAIEEVHFGILSAEGVIDAQTSYDSDTTLISTTVVLEVTPASSSLDNLKALANVALVESMRSAGVTTNVVLSGQPVLGGDDNSYYHHGGEDITSCTSGFGTRTSGGTRGISTAGHCGNSQTDDGQGLTFRNEHYGTHGDFQWHSGPQSETDDFYSGSSSSTEVELRDVAGIGAGVTGQALCKNGVAGHKDCQNIRKQPVCTGSLCNLVQMEERLAVDGDSGGPVFWGEIAYGLHQGWMYDPFAPYDRDVFSRADRIDEALGTYIATY